MRVGQAGRPWAGQKGRKSILTGAGQTCSWEGQVSSEATGPCTLAGPDPSGAAAAEASSARTLAWGRVWVWFPFSEMTGSAEKGLGGAVLEAGGPGGRRGRHGGDRQVPGGPACRAQVLGR